MYLKRLLTTGVVLMLVTLGCSDSGDDSPTGSQDSNPTISIADVNVLEGQSASFTILLSKAGTQAITFSYATNNGTAGSSDFTATSGTGTIDAGQTSKIVSVNTTDDADIEGNENFSLILSNSSVLFTGNDSVAVATIQDNDSAPVIQVNDLTVVEGESANFVFKLSKVQGSAVNIWFHTVNGTATDGLDYIGQADMETIAAGLDSVIQSISTIDDNEIDSSETFMIVIDSATVEVVDSVGVCTITNNDAAQPVSYSTDVQPILTNAGCNAAGSCHGSGASGLTLTNLSYLQVRNASGDAGPIVVAGDASSSNLYLKTTSSPPFGGRMPQGGPFLTTDQQNKIRDWINEGALDN